VLLAVFAGVPQAVDLLAICSLIVLCSVVVHGFSPVLLYGGRKMAPSSTVQEAQEKSDLHPEYITVDQIRELEKAGETLVVIDARTERTYEESGDTAGSAVRIDPERVVQDARAQRLAREAVLVAFCA
jgi:hypothetical protein